MSLNWWCRQWSSSRAVSGVTRHWARGSLRHSPTLWRTLSIIRINSYCCPSSSADLSASSRPSSACFKRCLRAAGIGVMNVTLRRRSTIRLVGWRFSSSSQCRAGYS